MTATTSLFTSVNGILQVFSCIKKQTLRIHKFKYNYIGLFLFLGRRRKMVKKICCRRLSRACNQSTPELFPRVFSEPKYQNYVALWYIYYRSIISILWMSIIVCSVFEMGSKKPRGKNYLWPIYLTNWDLLCGLIQSVLALIIVKRRWNIQQSIPNFDADNLTFKKIDKFYWFFYTVTLTLAIGVSSSYWILVYNPIDYTIDSLNIMVHVCNSLLIICDFIVTNVPLKFRHFWWSISIVIIYLIFSIIYYIAGGLDKRGKHCIYDTMDWKKPEKTILLSIGALLFLITVHCLFCYLSMLKNPIKRIINNISNNHKERATIKTQSSFNNNNNNNHEIIQQHHMEIV